MKTFLKRLGQIFLGLTILLGGDAVSAQDYDVLTTAQYHRGDFRAGELIVKFKDDSRMAVKAPKRMKARAMQVSAVNHIFAEIGVDSIEQLMPLTGEMKMPRKAKSFNGMEMDIPARMDKVYRLSIKKDVNIFEAIRKLQDIKEVEYAEPNYIVYSQVFDGTPDDPMYSEQYGLKAINIEPLWKEKTLRDAPTIAILDTGVDINHPDLQDNIWTNKKEANGSAGYDDDNNGFKDDIHGWNFVEEWAECTDNNGHGTHCAGIAAACGNNGIGVIGANPDAKIMPVCVLRSDGKGDMATIIRGVDYAVANGAEVLSMSFGTYSDSKAMREALGRAYQYAVLVAAAGNDGLDIYPQHKGAPMFPAAYQFVLGVHATNSAGGLASFSNFDSDGSVKSLFSAEDQLYNYELSAPGVAICSTYPQGQYKKLSGTSMSAPLVAGAISRMMQCKNMKTANGNSINQEIMFAELINSPKADEGEYKPLDIYKAFKTDGAKMASELSFVTFKVVDADGDGNFDAGETVEIYPMLRNYSGTAKNIKISVVPTEESPRYEILKVQADFGYTLSPYTHNISMNPVRVKIDETVPDGRELFFNFKAECDNIQQIAEAVFESRAENGINLGGVVDKDLTLEKGKKYILNENLAIAKDATLIIEPGVTIVFKPENGISCKGNIKAIGTAKEKIIFKGDDLDNYRGVTRIQINPGGTAEFKFCTFEDIETGLYVISGNYLSNAYTSIENCIFSRCGGFEYATISKSNFYNNTENLFSGEASSSNFVGIISDSYINLMYLKPKSCSFFNNFDKYSGNYSVGYNNNEANVIKFEEPSYFGSGREDIVRNNILDIHKKVGYGEVDLSNMLTQPSEEAHGIVWKVLVDGTDAQDEAEDLYPLGVGRHRFDVYFNRQMDKTVAPNISMGVREPYTQVAIAESGKWNAKGDVYTAYLTINGKQNIDGLNQIYVYGARDEEFFEIPEEKVRFTVNVQAAGAMSAGFMAEAGLGRVNLTWDSYEDNIDDLMGYNMYRYETKTHEKDGGKYNENGKWVSWKAGDEYNDTVQVNKQLLDVNETTLTDYEVVPKHTYYYYYHPVRTSFSAIEPSRTVAVTPLTAQLGDANGSGAVDVADVITTVNYASGNQPKPFIFEAADMNTDSDINILDVVGIIRAMLHLDNNAASVNSMSTVSLFMKDGQLWIDTPTEIAGMQFSIRADKDAKILGTEALEGFEQTGAWIGDDEYLFLAYNLANKTLPAGTYPVLNMADGLFNDAAFSDPEGHNLMYVFENPTSGLGKLIEDPAKVRALPGVYNVMGQKLGDSADELQQLPKGVYIVNGQKVVK